MLKAGSSLRQRNLPVCVCVWGGVIKEQRPLVFIYTVLMD